MALFFGACFGLCGLAGMLWHSILVLSWIAALAFFVLFAINFWRELVRRIKL